MNSISFAWRSLVRQPARACLGIGGIAVVGALLFDMLLVSRGLVLSFRDLLDAVGYDVRVTATRGFPRVSARIDGAAATVAALRALPEIEEVVPLLFGRAEVAVPGQATPLINFMGVEGNARNSWTLLAGSGLPDTDPPGAPPILVNRVLAERFDLEPGSSLSLRGSCGTARSARPTVEFRVQGIVEFRFDVAAEGTSVTTRPAFLGTCDESRADSADLLFVASDPAHGPQAAVQAIRRARPELHAFSNDEFVERLRRTDFAYFRQIGFVLSTVTLFFSFLLTTTLLTVSVNQRLGEVAALRALGFPRRRVATDLLVESVMLVGAGGLLALPLGALLALWLDGILRAMPGIPAQLHFFVFEIQDVMIHGVLLYGTGLVAALYPVFVAVRLPIAATLRREAIT